MKQARLLIDTTIAAPQRRRHHGKPMHKMALRSRSLRALEAAGLDDRLPHGFRRVFNDLMRPVSSGEMVRSIMVTSPSA